MTSDEQRREIAFAIHACARDGLNGMSFQKRLAQLCGVEGASWRDTMHAVADLINPTKDFCCDVADGYEGDHFQCSYCDTVWELTCGTPKENGMRFCPGCGRRIVHVS